MRHGARLPARQALDGLWTPVPDRPAGQALAERNSPHDSRRSHVIATLIALSLSRNSRLGATQGVWEIPNRSGSKDSPAVSARKTGVYKNETGVSAPRTVGKTFVLEAGAVVLAGYDGFLLVRALRPNLEANLRAAGFTAPQRERVSRRLERG